MPQISLDTLIVDQEDFVVIFQQGLLSQPVSVWNDLITAGVGQTLINYISSVGEYEGYAIQRAAEETLYDTARLDSSKVIITRMLGVHVQRATPAGTTVALAATTYPLFIPAYTQITIAGRNFFNRAPINIQDSTTVTAVLNEGTVSQQQVISRGGTLQRYTVGTGTGAISDVDLFCVVNGLDPYVKSNNPLWTFQLNQFIFFENTLPDGSVEVMFGNGAYGNNPNSNDSLMFTFVTTSGQAGNKALSGESVAIAGYPTITGATTTTITGGDDARSPSFYQSYGSTLMLENGAAIRQDGYNAVARLYPGVVDAMVLGQRSTFPNDVRYMNLFQYTIITNPTFSDGQHALFVQYLQTVGIADMLYQRIDPTTVPINVVGNLFCQNNADLSSVQNEALLAVNKFFTPKPGFLGFSVYANDIHTLVKASDPAIQYAQFTGLVDTVLTQTQYPIIGTLTLNVLYTSRTNPGSGS